MKETVKNKKITNAEIIFILGVLIFYTAWMFISPFGAPPDEEMRFDIPMYIFKHGVLPVGDDPELIGNAWGLSYAFFPILAYMVDFVFMKIVAIFTTDFTALLMAARFASVLFGTGTAFVSLKVGKKLFGNRFGMVFAVIVAFLPQNIFISSYVNNDAMAIFSTALIVWFWIRGIETKWDVKTCVGLAVSISICALSYYNAYGFILCSLIIYFATYFICDRDKDTYPVSKFLAKGFLIVGIVFVLCGWWFIRNAILYNGDFLGMKAMDACAELHAAPGVRPSEHDTLQKLGMSFFDMIFKTNWVTSVVGSFIGCFGAMKVKMHMWMYAVYGVFFLAAVIGVFMKKGKFAVKNKQGLFVWTMLIAAIIPNVLNLMNSYSSDYQPQGRYSLPMLLPFAFFITIGMGRLIEIIQDKRKKHKESTEISCEQDNTAMFHVNVNDTGYNITRAVLGCYIILSLIAYFTVMIPYYTGPMAHTI